MTNSFSPSTPPAPVHKSDFYQERDNAVYDTYLHIMREAAKPIDIDAVLTSLTRSPQPRFWVPARTVYNILRHHLRTRRKNQPRHTASPASSPPAVSPLVAPAFSPPAVSPLVAPASSLPCASPASPASPASTPSPLVRDVLAAYHRIRNRREYRGKSLYFIADFVTAEPTHGFYLSKRRLFDIIRRLRRERFLQRCNLASSLQSYERHTLLYGLNPKL